MLREWLRGSTAEPSATVETKPAARMVVDAERPPETTEETLERRRESFEKKLAESAKEGPVTPRNILSYDTVFRKAHSVLLEGTMNEMQEGISVNIARNLHNTLLTSKWTLATPQMSNWELTTQMNGFNDIVSASWSTLNRYQLLYQRVPNTGAVMVAQFMAQKQQGMVQGNVFGMLQYPWWFGGTTQVQYIKDQSFSLSHLQRLVRGLYFGSNLTLNPTTRSSTLTHAISFTTPNKDATLSAEISPAEGAWKVAATAFDWGQNMDAAMELEYKEGKEGMISLLNFGCRKNFVGGAQLTTSLLGFNTVKANLTLPYGGEVPGVNQLRLQLSCQYDMHVGKLKQGISVVA